jgi:protein-tyrosine phosphatase
MSLLLRSSFCIGLLVTLAGPVIAADSAAPDVAAMTVVAPDSADSNRVIPLEGALNVRDLGGLMGDHGAVPYDHFIRAANLAKLTPADREVLYKHDVVLDIDLRTPEEDRGSPDALASDPHIRYLPISLLGASMTRPTSLRGMYVDALASDQPQFKQVFEAIAAAGQGGVLYHCTVGKDRTGMISAMLLQLAGVPRDQIVHNYAVSAYYLKPLTETGPMADIIKKQPAVAALMASPPDAIEGFLDALDSQYGGTAAYLTRIGVSAGDIAKIRARLAG